MNADRRKRWGFSLVELVIVIVIIGIIAAIAVPRISRGAKGATDSALKGDLSALRAAIDLYSAEHNGIYPGKMKNDGTAGGLASDFLDQVTKYSKASGATGAYNVGNGTIYGPYLRNSVPPLPVGTTTSGSTDVLFDATNSPPVVAEAGGQGWVYNANTGEILANTLATDEGGTAYSTY